MDLNEREIELIKHALTFLRNHFAPSSSHTKEIQELLAKIDSNK